jgi:hypothetical protein
MIGSLPNPRLKLSGRGGRVVGNWSVLSAAAPARSLSAIRYAAPRRWPRAAE